MYEDELIFIGIILGELLILWAMYKLFMLQIKALQREKD